MENLASVANGSSMLHEATEGAIASYQALNEQSSVPSNGSGYKQADASAFPQPFDEVSSFLMSDNRVILNKMTVRYPNNLYIYA